jgi:TatD DNase family protein
MPQYFDIHSHLNFEGYRDDLEAVMARMRESGTHTIVVGTNYEDSRQAVALADTYPEVYASIGIHPVDDVNAVFDKEKFAALAQHPKVVAIGECGLDFFHQDIHHDFERQKKLFLEQVEFAIEHDKPLMIHAREAYAELLELLAPYRGKVRGNVHFFAGDWATAERFFALDFTVSFTGVITFATSYDEVIRKAPLERIMAETDAPFVAPVPYRGSRNEPAYVAEVAKRIAAIRGEDEALVRSALVQNALRMVG